MIARRLGDRTVGAIAAGTVQVSVATADHAAGVRVLCAALDAGVTVIDTAAAYVPSSRPEDASHNERIVADALRTWGGDAGAVTVVTKGGHARVGDGFGPDDFVVRGTPGFIRQQCEQSLRALGREVIDVYLLHWPDPAVPIEESMHALVALVDDGLVRHVGLSNVSVDQLDAASSVGRVTAVQNRFGLGGRGADVVRRCEQLDVAFMAYSPLGGTFKAKDLTARHPAVATIAEARRVSPQQVALAWVVSRSPQMIAVVGASRPESIIDSAAAGALELSADELAALS